MTRQTRIFNLEEANALLPALESLLAEFEAQHEAFQRLEDGLFFEEILENNSPAETRLQELETSLTQLETQIERIRELGCLLRHPERGWVDFLARSGSEWICYCWRRGEQEIQFFHTLRGGFFERRPLTQAV